MNRLADLGTYSFIVAAIFVLTRPGSQGPGLVTAIGNAYSGIVQAVTGGGSFWPPTGTKVTTSLGKGTYEQSITRK